MATINSGNSTTLYSTTQTTTSVNTATNLPAPQVNETNFTTLYSNSSAAASGGGTSGNLLVAGNLRVLGTSDLEGAVTISNSYILPTSDGTANQVVVTDGAGNLTFQNVTSLSSYAIQADTATGGADLTLVGSSTTDSVKFASGTNITVSRTDANTITISTNADDIPNGTAQGQVLYWDGSAWTASSNIKSSASANRLFVTYENSTAGTNAAQFLQKDYGATNYSSANEDGVGTAYALKSNSQGTSTFGVTSFRYSATDPKLVVASSTDNFANFIEILTSTKAETDLYSPILKINSAGQAVDSYIYLKGNTVFVKYNNTTDYIEMPRTAIDNVFIDNNTISTSSGNLNLDAFTNLVTVSAALYVSLDTTLNGDLAVNGNTGPGLSADITTTNTTASVFNTTATTLNIGGASTTTNIGANTGTTNIGADLHVNGNYDQYGESMKINADATNADSYLYMKGTSKFLSWDETNQFFRFTDTVFGNDAVIGNSYIATNGNNIYFNNDDVSAADSYLTVKRGASADVSLRWNQATSRWQFTNDGTTYYDMVVNLDDLADVVITAPLANGQLLSYQNSSWVNDNLIISTTSADRNAFVFRPLSPSAGPNAALFLRKDYSNAAIGTAGAGTYTDGAGSSLTFQVDSDSQGLASFGTISSLYSTTNPSFIFNTSTNNFSTNTQVASFDSTTTSLSAASLILSSENTGAAADSYLYANRGSSGADAFLQWSESNSWWGSGSSLFAADGVIGANYLATNGNNIYFNNDDGAGADAFLTVKRGASPDVSIKWNNSTTRWQTTVDGTNYINIPNQDLDTTANPSFAGVTGGNVTVGVDTDQTISTTSGNLILQTAVGVNAGTITLASGTNGAITLAPNGTGSVAVNASSGITTNQTTFPLVNATATTINMGGAATTTSIGSKTSSSILNGTNRYTSPAIFGFGGSIPVPNIPYRGLMISNGNAGSNATARTGLRMTVFPTGAVAPRGGIILEASRGNETTPSALLTNDQFGEYIGSGYATNSWVNDIVAAPASTYFYATEGWANTGGPAPTAGTVTNSGSGYIVSLQPNATNLTGNGASRTSVLDVNPQTFNTRSDAYNFKSKANTNLVTIAGDGQLQVFNTNATANNNLYGYRTKVLSTTTENANGNNIEIKPGKLTGATSYDKQTQISVIQNTTDGSVYANLEVKTQRFDGTNYGPTQSGDTIGRFLFNGNYVTGATPAVGNGNSLAVMATETWTGSASGTKLSFNITKTGTNTGLTVLDMGTASSTFKSDAYTFQDSAGTNIVGSKIAYNRVYGQFQYDTTVTPVAADTAYVFPLGTADINNIATVGSTSRLIAGAAGIYNLQFSIQVDNADNSNDHDAYIWLRKNGSDVTGSMGRTTVPKNNAGSLKIIAWNYLVSSANVTDYWEIAYAVSDTDVTFPAFAATAFGPSTACIITSLTPVGA